MADSDRFDDHKFYFLNVNIPGDAFAGSSRIGFAWECGNVGNEERERVVYHRVSRAEK
jgi:hypothetical protein